MIGWSDAAKSCHALLHHLPGFIVQCIIILIIKETVDIGKRPVNELLFHPFISLRIFPLKAHVDSHRLVCHGQSQCHHNTVILNVPHGLDTTLDHIQFVKWKEQCQIFFSGHSFFFDEVIFRQVHRLIFHKVWCGRQRSHQSKQAIFHRKLLDSLLNFSIRLFAHTHASYVDGIQYNFLILCQWIINTRLRRLGGREIQSSVLCRPPFIFTIPHPVRTGAFKKVLHIQNPPSCIVT